MYSAGHGQDYQQQEQQQRHRSHPRDDEDGNGPPPSKRPRNSPQVTDGYGNNANNNNAPAFVGGGGGGGAPPQDGHGRGSPVVVEGSSSSSSKMRSPVVPRPQEKDKNRRLSCKECRRLKLKCDRVFPCQSCVKRGCGSLCPEGALTSGRGSRFILANTEQLHEKITQLSDRVRELEEALEHLQSTVSDQPHPLLSPEKLRVKTSQDLYGIAPPALPPPQLQPPPQSYPQQPVAGPSRLPPPPAPLTASSRDVSPVYTTDATNPNPYPPVIYPAPPEVHPDVLQLSATFPFPWSVDLRIRKLIRDSLPARHEAQAICEQAQQNALWQYHLDASETFLQNLLHHCYSTPIEDLSPRRLALLLMLLSVGSIVDLTRPLGSLHGEAYHHLARASVCEIPLMEEPDFDELHALFFMIWWHLIFSDNKKAVGYAWNLMGFVAKLAQGLGLHRDSPRLKGIPEEYEKRRAIFWELLNLDARLSLSLGRPPSICLSHVDIKRPSFSGSGIYVPREEIIYHEWKNAFFIQCLTPVLEAIVVVDPPSYAQFLELDRLVRDFSVPSLLDEHHRDHREGGERGKRFLVMQRALVASSREIVLLQLHRRFFAEAMSSPEPFDLHHKYAPSVLATYLGAASLISTIETLFDHEPQLSARFLYFWFNSYSAAVTLSLFVFRAPLTPFAPNAYKELDRICRMFRNAAKILPVSGRILPLVEKLAAKARACLLQHQNTRSSSSAPGPSNELTHRQHPAPQPWSTDPHLPLSRKDVHPTLLRYAEELKSSAASLSDLPPSPLLSSSYPSSSRATPTPTPSTTSDSWLPDIYRYSSAGISLDAMYASSAASPAPSAGSASSSGPAGQAQGRQRTPFTPSSPRVDGKEEFNLDHGSLAGEFGETSYMAWF